MSVRALFFFPHCPVPPRSGAHQRCLATLSALRELGCRVTFFGSRFTSETEWSEESIALLREGWVDEVVLHELSAGDRLALRLLPRYYRWLRRTPPLTSRLGSPPGMRLGFRRAARVSPPDLVFMNYVYWDGLVSAVMRRRLVTAVEVHDFVTLNTKMRAAVAALLPEAPARPDGVEDALLREDFFDRLALAPDQAEIELYGRYRYVISICPQQTALLKARAGTTEVVEIPATHDPVAGPATHTGAPCFATGPNPFNVQGYLFFARRVLPGILAEAPAFRLDVTGAICDRVAPVAGVALLGVVPDPAGLYGRARFAISPVLATTGQQIKIVEAMAHGLPVVAMRQAAEGSPIAHASNGFLADDAEGFARHTLALWRNAALCRTMGERARQTVAAEYSIRRVVSGLRPIVERAARIRQGRGEDDLGESGGRS